VSDIFGEILGVTQAAIGDAPLTSAYQGTLIRSGLAAGLSGNQIIQGLQDAGIGTARQSMLRLISNQRALNMAGDIGPTLAWDQIPDANNIGEVAAGRPGSYYTRFRAIHQLADEEGNAYLEERWSGVYSRVPISPAQGWGVLQDIPVTDDTDIAGATVRSVEYMGTVQYTGA
jgi:hypothetical protein